MRRHLIAAAALLALLSPANAADTTVNAMSAASALGGTELIYVVQGGADRKATPAQVDTYVRSLMGTGVSTWLNTPSSANLAAALTDKTGTGVNVFATSPTLVTPNLGTPSAATLTNATGLPISTGVSGLAAGAATFLATPSSANLATLLTDETGSGANVFGTAPTISSPTISTTATLSFVTGSTQCLQVNSSGVISGFGAACGGAPQAPQVTVLTTGSGTYNPPAGALYLEVEMIGGGGGGGGSTTGAGNGGTGGTTTFGTALLSCTGGGGGTGNNGGLSTGGTCTGMDFTISGAGGSGSAGGNTFGPGGGGGISPFGNAGVQTQCCSSLQASTPANTGSGGAGAATTGTANNGSGGAAGGYGRKTLTSVLSSYAYAVGAAGTAGTAGSGPNQVAGQAGGSGFIIITARFQ